MPAPTFGGHSFTSLLPRQAKSQVRLRPRLLSKGINRHKDLNVPPDRFRIQYSGSNMTPAFLTTAPVSLCRSKALNRAVNSQKPAPKPLVRRGTRACAPAPTDAASAFTAEESPLLPESKLPDLLEGTMLAREPLALAYTSSRYGFDNEAFFDRLMPLGGVPSLVLGQTSAGTKFGGYTAYGFLARDDYREAATERSMFVFRVEEDDDVLVAENTDPVQYDFYDYAVRLGAAMLGVPMNPRKHTMKSDVGTSSCRLPNGETSVFGDATLAKIDVLQVWVAQRYVEEVKAKKTKAEKGLFGRLFG